LLDPLSADETHLRTAIVPVLLRRLEHNLAHGRRDARLFEIGTVFVDDPESDGVLEETRVGAVITGRRRPPHWSEDDEAVDEWTFKGLANEVVDRLLGGRVEPASGPSEDGAGLPLRGGDWLSEPSYRILIGDRVVGVAGRARDDAYDAQRHGDAVWGFEFRLNGVRSGETVIYDPVSTYPAVLRDLALAVRPGVPAADIAAAIREAAPASMERLELFDVYEDEAVETGRSLAWSFVFRASDRTLTDEEVDTSMKKILAMLEKRFDARIRSA
jgi:phenylalanyl-tRNA synthetase beta chain